MASKANLKTSGREAALARRRALSTGGKSTRSASSGERARPSAHVRQQPVAAAPTPAAVPHQTPAATPPAGARSGVPAVRRRPPVAAPTAARQRREALSRQGRRGLRSQDRTRTPANTRLSDTQPAQPAKSAPPAAAPTKPALSLNTSPTSRARSAPHSRVNQRRDTSLSAKPTGRMLSQARRSAQSGRGKAATNTPNSAASLARQANPKLSGRELAQRVRAQRSHNGGAGERKSAPTGRLRPMPMTRGAEDQAWKVGASETAAGQVVTGTLVGRSHKTTGDEPSTCRAITGTEYMGADLFREFCQSEPPRGVAKVGENPSSLGNRITGTEVGRSARVTGDEPGSCKRVTGTDYLSPAHYDAFCDTRPEPNVRRAEPGATRGDQMAMSAARVTGDELGASVTTTGTQYTDVQSIAAGIPAHQLSKQAAAPTKVGVSSTLSGGRVTGTQVGRTARVTGDEPGSCRAVTGDEYLSAEQFDRFCAARPQPEPPKVGHSQTLLGQRVSGTSTGRSNRVTGDEPGTCKIVTGTPYAGLEQTVQYCPPAAQQAQRERMLPMARRSAGAGMTGQGPSVGGKLTGDERGACEPLTGTPYLGADQQAAACPPQAMETATASLAATPDDSDYPQPLQGAPWQAFSIASPARQADQQRPARTGAVTGTRSENGRGITGPFGMATGKITGTEEFRFGRRASAGEQPPPSTAEPAPKAARVTGEGQSAGLKITGDDWDRGERVTGTEGAWAKQRNPSRPGAMSAMPPVVRKRNEETPVPVSRVTGSSGSTERGSLVTYSGGARG